MIRPLLSLVLAMFVSSLAAAATEDAALQRIQEEIANRRKLRQRALDDRGAVFEPMEVSAVWLKQKRELRIDEEALGLCGQTLATLTQKEVMVSGRIAKKEVSVYLGRADAEEASLAFRSVLKEQGVAVVPVGDQILVLMEAQSTE